MSWRHRPTIIQWDITSSCNLRCRHCRAGFVGTTENGEHCLGFDQVSAILSRIKSFSPKAVLALAGGEPLARRDLKRILFLAKELGISVELLTNGTRITSRNVSWLCETVRGFNVSLEGASSEVNDIVRGRGSFQKAVRGIKLLIKHNASVAVRMTYFGQEEDEPEKLMRFISGLGVGFFNFRYFVPVGRACQGNVSAEQYKRLSEKIWSLGKVLDLKIGFSDPFPELLLSEGRRKRIDKDMPLLQGEAVTGCSSGFYLLYLDPFGIIRLCPYFPVEIADAKTDDLKQVWFKSETLNLFRRHRSALEGKCGKCKYKFACGGCRGAAFGSTGNFLSEEPRCWFNP